MADRQGMTAFRSCHSLCIHNSQCSCSLPPLELLGKRDHYLLRSVRTIDAYNIYRPSRPTPIFIRHMACRPASLRVCYIHNTCRALVMTLTKRKPEQDTCLWRGGKTSNAVVDDGDTSPPHRRKITVLSTTLTYRRFSRGCSHLLFRVLLGLAVSVTIVSPNPSSYFFVFVEIFKDHAFGRKGEFSPRVWHSSLLAGNIMLADGIKVRTQHAI